MKRGIKVGIKVGAALAAGLLVLSGCGSSDSESESASTSAEGSDVSVGLAYDIGGRGDQSFNDSAGAGLDEAEAEFGISVTELEAGTGETAAQKEERLRLLAQGGSDLVIAVGSSYAEPVAKVAVEFPAVSFAIVDDSSVEAPNVASLVFAEEQGSALVGAIAAEASQTGKLGFVGGVNIPLIRKFEAGFVAGAKSVNPEVEVTVKYLTEPPNDDGFNDPARGRTAAEGMYDQGADVVYHASGGSGTGVFEAANAAEALAIGVDKDQYLTAPDELKPVILSSMIKRVDAAVFNTIEAFVDGAPLTGVQTFDLAQDGVGYSTSNPAVEPYTATAEELKQQIIDGTVTIPTKPGS